MEGVRKGSGGRLERVRRGSEGLLAARPENGRWESVFWDPLGAVLGRFLGPSWRLGRRLGPTLVVLVRLKIDAKIDRKSDASWNRFLERFWWIFGRKTEACWHQNQSKIEPNFEERFFEKTLFFLRKNNDFEGSGGRSWR